MKLIRRIQMISSSNIFQQKAILAIEASKPKDQDFFRELPKPDGQVECPIQAAGGLK